MFENKNYVKVEIKNGTIEVLDKDEKVVGLLLFDNTELQPTSVQRHNATFDGDIENLSSGVYTPYLSLSISYILIAWTLKGEIAYKRVFYEKVYILEQRVK